MQVYDGLATFGGEKEGAVFLVVHEEILGEDCRAERVLEDVERLLEVRITVGVVHAELVAGEVILGGDVEEAGDVVGFRVAGEGVGAPAAGVHPFHAVAGCVDVDGDEDGVGYAVGGGNPVDAVHAFLQGDIFGLSDDELCVVAPGDEALDDSSGNFAVVAPFHEGAVGRGFTFGVDAMSGIEEYFLHHNSLILNVFRWNN